MADAPFLGGFAAPFLEHVRVISFREAKNWLFLLKIIGDAIVYAFSL